MNQLWTEEGQALAGQPLNGQANEEQAAACWEAYPRPQMVRGDWLNLNGEWAAAKDGEPAVPVRVPFPLESLLSGYGKPVEYGKMYRFQRSFRVPSEWTGKRVLLHFGAVSRLAEVWVDGTKIGTHENSYLSFALDITDALQTDDLHALEVRVTNDISHRHPWGKQKIDRGGMWYTPVTGIWQSVWLEAVPETYIEALKVKTGADWAEITVKALGSHVEEIIPTVLMGGEEYKAEGGTIRIPIKEPHLWSPEDPHLYRFSVTMGDDRVESYFALRTLTTETVNGIKRLCLNGKPYFFNGLLDQGYWSDGLYTPAVPEAYEKDILAMKSLGFNTLRKHIKIEPEQFYYDCDRLGMIVFQDMVNCGEYSFLRDTGLPTIGLKLGDRNLHKDAETRRNFVEAMEGTVRQLSNHPSICYWTIFNEAWGQFCADEMYDRLKKLDDSRFIDSTSGWFHQTKSDVDSLHIYFKKLKLGKEDKPQMLSEFGGYVYKVNEHSFNTEKTYGYALYGDREKFVEALRSLYKDQLLPLVSKGLCGAIYTQVSDVEDETNGFFTYDRAVLKIKPEELKDLADALQRTCK